MLGIRQTETHMTNMDPYRMADEHLISEMIRECQLQFTRHCLCQVLDGVSVPSSEQIYIAWQWNTCYQRWFASTSSSSRHCLRKPKDEPVNIYVIYQTKIRRSNRHGNPGLTYLNQISKYLCTHKTVRFSAEERANYAKDKQLWNLSIDVHKLPDWWWWGEGGGGGAYIRLSTT